ncbi:MAG: sugar phosphate isomerase/epimerase [Rhodothermales bacterium]|nr:sugar phosphate isomerase/epimerase [Rhodothermales bacterium]
MGLSYAVHAYAWTTSWSNATLDLIDHVKSLGFDLIEIPLMELELIDPDAIRQRLERVGLRVVTSTAISESTDITSGDDDVRRSGIKYLKGCVEATAAMGGESFSGVIYSAIGRKIDGIPGPKYWENSATALKEVAAYAAELGITLGIEPINRYESFLINTCEQGLRLIDMIGAPNVKLHLDAYHMNIEEDEFYAPTMQAAGKLCHFHLSESHRGTPGTGTVDWRAIYQALADQNYHGVVGLESFNNVSDAMRAATCVWRLMAPSSDHLLSHGLTYLRDLEREIYSATD